MHTRSSRYVSVGGKFPFDKISQQVYYVIFSNSQIDNVGSNDSIKSSFFSTPYLIPQEVSDKK